MAMVDDMADKQKLSIDEKKQLNKERQKAVKEAWEKEKELVVQGEGTRDWLPEQQKEILENGRVGGYDGHHMKSVISYPEQAGNPENIQFLSENEHFEGAHQGNFHNQTNGYYNPHSGLMEQFDGSELKPVESQNLSEPCYENGEYVGAQNAQSSAFIANAKKSNQEINNEASSFNDNVKQSNFTEEGSTYSNKTQLTAMSR